ncbi:hypothetical protein NIES2100_05310 [Calothrix sp. NIES-2100]|uniref:hypothetical protein n=1 Tax=Calothrix sp. NIES-2100 TaxID=1954172 RepID=UPI000B5F18C8|nr:hypothetical protein NIES2100_05310 [Calothrix sp. NIES-2100]
MAIFPVITVSGINYEAPETFKKVLRFSDGNEQSLHYLSALTNAKLTLILDFINQNEVSELLKFWDIVGGLTGSFTLPDEIFKQPTIIKSLINTQNVYWKFENVISVETIVASSVRGLFKTSIKLVSVPTNISVQRLTIYSGLDVMAIDVYFCETIAVQDYQAPVTISNANVLYSEQVINFTTGSIFKFINNAWQKYTPGNGTVFIHKRDETAYQYIDGNLIGYTHNNFKNPVSITNATPSVNSSSGALIVSGGVGVSGSVYSNGVDTSGYRSFTVGGNVNTFYPVQIKLIQPSNLTGSGKCQIYRSSLQTPITNAGTFNLEFRFQPYNYGNQVSIIDEIKYEYSLGTYTNAVGDIRDGTTTSSGNDCIVWLRGNLNYNLKSLDAGQHWEIVNSNPNGTSISDSSGFTHNPTTVQTDLILNANWRTLTLQNGSSNYSADYHPARAIKKQNGDVEIQGTIQIPSKPSLLTTIATLPVGMRTSKRLIFNGVAANVNITGTLSLIRFFILPTGEIIYENLNYTDESAIYVFSINFIFSTK